MIADYTTSTKDQKMRMKTTIDHGHRITFINEQTPTVKYDQEPLQQLFEGSVCGISCTIYIFTDKKMHFMGKRSRTFFLLYAKV